MKKSVLYLLSLVIVFLTIAGRCDNKEAAGPIAIETFAQGQNASGTGATQKVINSKSDWQKFWKSNLINQSAKAPDVNFKESTIISVVMDRQQSGGYNIEIVQIEEQRGKLVVSTKETVPEPNSPVTLAQTQPYHLVLVPKTDKEVVFITIGGELTFETVNKGSVAYSDQAIQTTISDMDAWTAFWNQNMSGQSEPAPSVDFSNQMVIAIIDEQYNSGGFDLEIVKVVEETDKITVFYIKNSPKPTDFVTMAMTRPYHYISIAKSDKAVNFALVK